MKAIAVKKLHRGLAHCHSEHSFDASCTYIELRERFLENGLNFACITEHIEYLDQDKVNAIVKGCREASSEEFLFIPGIEMDYFKVYFLGIGEVEIDFSSPETIFNDLRNNAKICALSHPIKAKFKYPSWILELCDVVEIMNNKHDGKFYFRPQSVKLLKEINKSKPSVMPIVGMDFHEPSQFCAIHMRLDNPVPFTADSVLEEIKSGNVNFYNGDRNLNEIEGIESLYLSARIYFMDFVHLVHRKVRACGIRLPKPLRRTIARIVEGE